MEEDDMDVQTDERLLRNIEGYLMELICIVESIDEVNLIADVLISVQDALRDLAQRPRSSQIQTQQQWGTRDFA
jgi:hypothetical protein